MFHSTITLSPTDGISILSWHRVPLVQLCSQLCSQALLPSGSAVPPKFPPNYIQNPYSQLNQLSSKCKLVCDWKQNRARLEHSKVYEGQAKCNPSLICRETGGGGKTTDRFIPCQRFPLICNFFFMNSHTLAHSGHMSLIRLPAPLSHLHNPAEVKEYSSLLLFLLRLMEHKSVESVFNMEAVLLVKAVCMAAGWTRWCNNRWIMQEAACRPLRYCRI